MKLHLVKGIEACSKLNVLVFPSEKENALPKPAEYHIANISLTFIEHIGQI
ncbi:hypothetical protein HP439_08560 [Sphingobacterium shayense]|uniref:hypothetical protein n=1 Tax=Sphingobacterium shayense TaxID=626343 RepID=UPI00155604E9|nr:hypothetical protein [Sphingobacterium shayense]NQD70767.1 hypothetical protein [Sphingobacterium shayense]